MRTHPELILEIYYLCVNERTPYHSRGPPSCEGAGNSRSRFIQVRFGERKIVCIDRSAAIKVWLNRGWLLPWNIAGRRRFLAVFFSSPFFIVYLYSLIDRRGETIVMNEKAQKTTIRLDAGQIEVVDDAMAEALKKKTPAQRLAIGASLMRAARTLVKSHLHEMHPEWDEAALAKEIARRFSHGTS